MCYAQYCRRGVHAGLYLLDMFSSIVYGNCILNLLERCTLGVCIKGGAYIILWTLPYWM